MKTAWSHLPNAVHIDRILASVKAHPEEWGAAGPATRNTAWDAAQHAARDAAWKAARGAAWGAARIAAQHAARDAAWKAARGAARIAARDASWGAITTLIAWDDSSKWLNMPSDKLKVWYALSDDPACILLLPAVVAFERIKELEVA